MIKKGRVSIVITTYKGASCIDRAIESLLNQTYKDIEIIVVDDNNPDSLERAETQNIVEKYFRNNNLKYIKHEKNSNGAVARNSGIKVATGEFIGFLDDDDYYYDTKIEKCVENLNKNKNIEAVFCGVVVTDEKYILNIVNYDNNTENLQKKLLFNVNMFGTGSNLFLRKECVENIGGFDISYYRLQDVEFLIRFFEKYRACFINEILVVKGRGYCNNLPEYKKLYNIKQKFYMDFKYILEKLNSKELNDYYKKEYGKLLQICFGKESKDVIFKAKEDLMKYRRLTIKEQICVYLSIIGNQNFNAYKIIRHVSAFIMKPIKSSIIKYKNNIL